jgi:parallel beta-helix repeat protein
MRRLLGLGLLAALAVAVPTLSAAPALGNHVQCGDTITQDTTLDSSVICADDQPGGIPDDAIVIGADNITLDLNGHVVRGSCQDFGAGVLNIGHRGVTIENGELTGEPYYPVRGYFGVRLENADDNILRNLVALVCGAGSSSFSLTRSDGNHISDVVTGGYRPFGILLWESNANTIEESTLGGSWAIELRDSHENHIRQNSVGGAQSAMSLTDSTRNRITQNTVSGGFGIGLNRSNENVLRDNLVFRTQTQAIGVADSDYNRLTQNFLVDNGLPYPPREIPASDGLFVTSDSDETLLKHNEVIRSGKDGIVVENATTTLIANRANENGGLGISAVPGVHAHGNKAFGNGDPLQCLNVVCK